MTVHGGDTLAALRAESAANEIEALAKLIAGLEAVLPALEVSSRAGSEGARRADEAVRGVAVIEDDEGKIDIPDGSADESERQVTEGVERLRVEIVASGTGAGPRPETAQVSRLETALDKLLALQMPGGGFGAPADADWERGSVIATVEAVRAAIAALACLATAHAAAGEPGNGARGNAACAVERAMAWLFAAWSEEGFGDHPGTPPRASSTSAALAALRDYASLRQNCIGRDEP